VIVHVAAGWLPAAIGDPADDRNASEERAMLSVEDCIALSELSEEEVAAIAEHEHLPDIVAAELGNYLVHTPGGVACIRRYILDDIDAARTRGDFRHAAALKLVLRHFIEEHAEAGSDFC
jgi:hypothetical protein